MLTKLSQLLAQGRFVSPVPAVVVHPTTDIILQSCIQAHQHHIITPILVGPKHKIEKAATDASLDISGFMLVDAEHSMTQLKSPQKWFVNSKPTLSSKVRCIPMS